MQSFSTNELQRLCYLEALDINPLIPKKILTGAKQEKALFLPKDWQRLFEPGRSQEKPLSSDTARREETNSFLTGKLTYEKLNQDDALEGSSTVELKSFDLAAISKRENTADSEVRKKHAPAEKPDAQRSQAEPVSESPLTFTLSCWQLDGYLIFDEFEPKSAYPVPKLLSNIFAALLGKRITLSSTQTLRWPVVKACSAESGGKAAARTMLASMLSAITMPPEAIVLCGELPARLFLYEPENSQQDAKSAAESVSVNIPNSSSEPDRLHSDFDQFDTAKIIQLPGLMDVLKDPLKKQVIQNVLFT